MIGLCPSIEAKKGEFNFNLVFNLVNDELLKAENPDDEELDDAISKLQQNNKRTYEGTHLIQNYFIKLPSCRALFLILFTFNRDF